MPDIDYTAWRFWFDVVQTFGTILIGVYVWLVNRKKAVDRRFAKIEAAFDRRCATRKEQIEALEKDKIAVQMQLAYMPTHKDIKEMSEKMELVQRSMSKLSGRLEGINRAVDLLNEYHINQGGKGMS